jgi:hypothetical protein
MNGVGGNTSVLPRAFATPNEAYEYIGFPGVGENGLLAVVTRGQPKEKQVVSANFKHSELFNACVLELGGLFSQLYVLEKEVSYWSWRWPLQHKFFVFRGLFRKNLTINVIFQKREK